MIHKADIACNCNSSNCDSVQSLASRTVSTGFTYDNKANKTPISENNLKVKNKSAKSLNHKFIFHTCSAVAFLEIITVKLNNSFFNSKSSLHVVNLKFFNNELFDLT